MYAFALDVVSHTHTHIDVNHVKRETHKLDGHDAGDQRHAGVGVELCDDRAGMRCWLPQATCLASPAWPAHVDRPIRDGKAQPLVLHGVLGLDQADKDLLEPDAGESCSPCVVT